MDTTVVELKLYSIPGKTIAQVAIGSAHSIILTGFSPSHHIHSSTP